MPCSIYARLCAAFLASAAIVCGQRPVISPNGVVNAASYYGSAVSDPVVEAGPNAGAPGEIASIFGTNLAFMTLSAAGVPLRAMLGGTSVQVNGVAAPLFYVSPNQINFQVPTVGHHAAGNTLTVTTPFFCDSSPSGIAHLCLYHLLYTDRLRQASRQDSLYTHDVLSFTHAVRRPFTS
jgi:hypothetical protein